MADMTLQGLVGAADGVTQSFLSQTYPAIAGAISTPITYAAMLYWALYGYKVYAGHSPMQWKDLLAKTVMTVAVFGTLNWSGLAQTLYNAFVSFMEGAAATVMAGKPTAQMLDALWNNVEAVSSRLRSVDFYQFAMICDGIILFVVNCILFVLALVYMTIAKFGLAITMVLCPLFLGFLMFPETRQWFMNWVSKMLTFCFMYILVIAIVRFGFLAFGDAIDTAGKVAQSEGLATSEQTAQLVIVEGVLILFMLGVRGWASALAGGASSSTGTLMMIARMVMTKGAGK
ncbi:MULTISPECIES: type IV secretion system protein [Xanthomonas]|uniref:type IV secretion system protein n=4 Tax=Xanthomonas TaxID=338 RepID=UPI00030B7C16|nr:MULTISPECIES: type IV secretion system protein [Xanthomonas]ASY87016.1 type VI secretion protein [Xanthomonas citri pv. malvacearum]KUF27370.1 type VI secretion protein [Xanthomonas phaseoli pv. manihotis]MBO9757361.1 type IV secretion system protein [Xanthomonas phaseoli pv. manihotis]MBO9766043.1 type IV secretion system protein [Xanthomonas phaseoli pv. manihotis]MCC8532599.1 type IV secretion system protein [Xanthomonas phaseoli]